MPDDETHSPLELLYNVSRELASALDLRTVLQRILFQSLKYVGGERGSIVVMDDNGKVVDSAIVYGRKIHDHTTQQLRETVERGLAGWVVRKRQPAWVPDTSKDERWLRRPDDALDKSGAKAALCVPLMARERLVGVLTLVHPEPGAYTKEHFNLMQAIADQSGIAVLNARLYAESQRQARVMTALAVSAAAINASLRMDEVLQRILNETIQALEVATVTLALVEPNWDLIFRAATGEHKEGIVGKRVPAGQGSLDGWYMKVRALSSRLSRKINVSARGWNSLKALKRAPWRSHPSMLRNASSAFYRLSTHAPARSTRMLCWYWPGSATWLDHHPACPVIRATANRP
jgi:hypothetical protein